MQAWKQQQAVQIGRNIREHRKLLGMTQSELAQGLFSVQSVSLIERGKLKVSNETLAILAERLQCQVAELCEMNDLHEGWLDEMLQQALRYQENGDIDQAIEAHHTLYSEALTKNNTKYLLESSSHLCALYIQAAKYSLSIEWGQQALQYLDPHRNLDEYLNLSNQIGRSYYLQGKMWEAYDLLREAESFVNPTLHSSIQAGRLFYSIAIIKQMLKNWEGCIWYCERALQILDQKNMTNIVGSTHMMLGIAYKHQNRFEKSFYHLDRSIRILAQITDQRYVARCWHNMGELQMKMKEPEKARESFLRSLKFKRQSKDFGSMLNTFLSLADLSMKQNQLEDAHHYLRECLEQAQQLENKLQLAMTWRYLGELALLEGNEAEFVMYYKRAIDQFERLEFSTELAESAEKLGDYYLEQGEELLAIPYLRIATLHYRKLLKQS